MADGTATGSGRLPCVLERGFPGIGNRRTSGSPERRAEHLRLERRSAWPPEWVHGEAGDAGSIALGSRRGEGSPVRGGVARARSSTRNNTRGLLPRSGNCRGQFAVFRWLPDGCGRRSRRQRRFACGPGEVVVVPRPRDTKRAGLAAQGRRDRRSRRLAATPAGHRGAQAPLSPDARNARQIGSIGGKGRRLRRGRRTRGSVARRNAWRS